MAPRSTYFINPALPFLAASPKLPSAGYGAGVLLERAEASRAGCTLGDRATHRIDNARLACSGKLRQALTVALLHSTAVLMIRRKALVSRRFAFTTQTAQPRSDNGTSDRGCRDCSITGPSGALVPRSQRAVYKRACMVALAETNSAMAHGPVQTSFRCKQAFEYAIIHTLTRDVRCHVLQMQVKGFARCA